MSSRNPEITKLVKEFSERKIRFDLYVTTVHDWAEETSHRAETLLTQYRRREASLYDIGIKIIDAAQRLHNQVWNSSSKFMAYGYEEISALETQEKADEQIISELKDKLAKLQELIRYEKQAIDLEKDNLTKHIEVLHQKIPEKFFNVFWQSLPQSLTLPDLDQLPFLTENGNVYHPQFICPMGGGSRP